jgi:hypothetical protein
MNPPRPVRLPERFYLPRQDADGREVRDVMPWEGAVCYASDGARIGVQYTDGSVTWLGDAPPLAEDASFADDFAGVDLNRLVEGLRAYVERHPVLQNVWADDLAQLEALRPPRPPGAEGEASAA